MFHQNVRAIIRSQARAKRAITAAAAAAAAALGWVGYGPAHAADRVKANNADALNLATAWSAAIVPTSLDVAVWNNTVAAGNTVPLGADTAWGGIRIENPGGPVNINDNVLTVGSFGINMSAATQDLAINSGFTLGVGASQTWNVGARLLTLGGAVTRSQGSTFNLITTGGGSAVVSTAGNTGSFLLAGTLPYGIVDGTDYAALDGSRKVVPGSTVLAYTQQTNSGNISGNPLGGLVGALDVTGNLAGNTQAWRQSNSLTLTNGVRFNVQNSAGNWTVDTSNAGRVLTTPAILITPNVGGQSVTFNGAGGVRAGQAGADLVLYQYNTAGNLLFNTNINGNGASNLVKAGPGLVILANTNGYTGATNVNEGALQLGNGGTAGDIGSTTGVILANNTTLAFNRSNAMDFTRNISGGGAVVVNMTATGSLTLSGTNTYTGATHLTGGLLNLTALDDIGGSTQILANGGGLQYGPGLVNDLSGSITVGSNGFTVNTNGNDLTFANALAGGGTGPLTKSGAGMLTLPAANAHTGAIVVNGGTLRVNGSAGNGGVTVNTGATLGGSGAVNGAITVNTGGHVAPGNSVGSFSTPALSLATGSVLDFEFGIGTNDKVNVTGSDGLTVNGGGFNLLVENTTSAFSAPGTYNLFQFAGSVQGTGPGALSVLNPQPGFSYTFGTSGNQLTLQIVQTNFVAQWNVDANGSWGTGANWLSSPPSTAPNGVGSIALFNKALGAARTVTLDGNKTVGGITFTSSPNGYTIAQGTSGTLFLDNGATAQLQVSTGSHSITAPVSLTSNTTVVTDPSTTLVVSGNVSGGGAITKNGAGALVLSGNNSFSGSPTTINAGTVEVGSNTALSSSAVNVNANAAIRAGGNVTLGNAITLNSGVTATLDSQGNTLTLTGDINDSGNGVLNKTGAGTVAIAGNANHGGSTTISAGFLSIGAGTTSGQISNSGAPITNNGTLVYNRSDDSSLGNVISGSGVVVKQGAGVLTLGGGNTYTGGTTVSAGTIRPSTTNWPGGVVPVTPTGTGTVNLASPTSILDLVDVPITTGAITGTGVITGNGGVAVTLTVDNPTDATFNGTITPGSDTLSVTKAGAGVWTLTGQSTVNGIYGTGNAGSSGVLALDGPTAQVDATAVPLSVSIGPTSAVRVSNGTLNAAGTTTIQNDGGAFIVSGGTVNIAGNFNIRRSGGTANADLTQGLQVSGGNLSVGGLVALSTNNSWGAMVQSGGTVNFTNTAANSFIVNSQATTGGRGGHFRITGGTFNVASSNGMVIDNNTEVGIAEFQGGRSTMEGIIVFNPAAAGNGVATLSVSAAGELYLGAQGISSNFVGLNNAGTQTTNVVLSGGTIGATAAWSSSLPMSLTATPGVTFKTANAANAPFDIALSGVLSGAGGLVKTGGATLTLSGNNTYTGVTTVNGGHLAVNASTGTLISNNAGGADIQLGRILIDYTGGSTPATDIVPKLKTAAASNFATGQFRSSAADATKGLGWKDDTTASQFIIAYTYKGDADLDGDADGIDIGTWATNFTGELSGGPTATRIWAQGDWDYDGDVDGVDAGLWATAFTGELSGGGLGAVVVTTTDPQATSILRGLGVTVVPEPATVGSLVAAIAAASLARRRIPRRGALRG